MTVTTTRTNPRTWGPGTTTFGVSSISKNYSRLRRTSQIETIYQTISNSNGLAVYINATNTCWDTLTNTGWDTLKGVPYLSARSCRNRSARIGRGRPSGRPNYCVAFVLAALHCSSIRFITCGKSSARSNRSFTSASSTCRAEARYASRDAYRSSTDFLGS